MNVVVETSSLDPHRATWRRGFSGWTAVVDDVWLSYAKHFRWSLQSVRAVKPVFRSIRRLVTFWTAGVDACMAEHTWAVAVWHLSLLFTPISWFTLVNRNCSCVCAFCISGSRMVCIVHELALEKLLQATLHIHQTLLRGSVLAHTG